MGTDIYLEWNNKSEEERKKQITGFDIRAGNIGYLRASIGMVEENSFLRQIFSNDYWEASYVDCEFCNGEGVTKWEKGLGFNENIEKNGCKKCNSNGMKDGIKGVRFIFNDKAMARFSSYVRVYLGHAVMGLPIDSLDSEHRQRAEAMKNTIFKAIGGGMDKIEAVEVSDQDVFFKNEWIQSVIQFFLLGYQKEKEGLEPRVYISW